VLRGGIVVGHRRPLFITRASRPAPDRRRHPCGYG
jgi:hypothetical protein